MSRLVMIIIVGWLFVISYIVSVKVVEKNNQKNHNMSKVARCKLKIREIKDNEYSPGSQSIVADTVYDPNPESENGKFFKATPSGSLQLHVVNTSSIDHLQVGDEIYLDIIKVEKKEQVGDEAAAGE